MVLNFDVTNVYMKNKDSIDSGYRFIINQGGSRSSKTWSICQLLIVYCLTYPNKEVDIIRKTLPSLRESAMKDFLSILKDNNIYNPRRHNKTNNVYEFDNGSTVTFYSADDEQKLRGRKRDIAWLNECNELSFEEFNQLNMRCTELMLLDFNPSEGPRHWIYSVQKYEESIVIKSTYKDNPFLSEAQVNEIERFKTIDEEYYKIYGLGEASRSKDIIYSNWKMYSGDIPDGDIIYGLDFGYNHPTSLVKVVITKDINYVEEMIYESGLTTDDLIKKMKDLGVSRNYQIVCDGARPETIEELRRGNFNVISANKKVLDGINAVKSKPLYVNENSKNIIIELNNYKWLSKGDEVLDIPIKQYDDALDAIRYAIYYRHLNKPSDFKYLINQSGYRR